MPMLIGQQAKNAQINSKKSDHRIIFATGSALSIIPTLEEQTPAAPRRVLAVALFAAAACPR